MSTLLKRWLLYLFVPMGIVLLFFPLSTHRVEEIKKDFLFLQISETLEGRQVKPLSNRSEDKTLEELKRELLKMQKLFVEETTTRNTYGYPILLADDLRRYPQLKDEVEERMRRVALSQNKQTHFRRLEYLSIEEWEHFRKTFLVDSGAFQYGNRIFQGVIKPDRHMVKVEINNLGIIYKVIGVLFLIVSVLMIRHLYLRASNGIQIGKQSTMILWDILIIGIGLFFSSTFIDAILVKYLQVPPLWADEEMALFMGIFWVVIANPILALFTTATSLQTLHISQDGITAKGLWGQKVIKWSEVKGVAVSELFTPRRVYGFYAPRKVMKVLRIEGTYSSLHIMEPPLISTKREIMEALMRYAPVEFKEKLDKVSQEWLSLW